jgi:hypothetical protein
MSQPYRPPQPVTGIAFYLEREYVIASLYRDRLLGLGTESSYTESFSLYKGGMHSVALYQLNIKTPTFATNISASFYIMTFFTTCFGPDQWPSSGDIV